MMNFLKCFSVNYFFSRRRWLYPLISAMVTLSLCLGTYLPSQAVDWLPLILRGVQAVQLSNMSERQEVELGKQMNQEILGEMKLYRNSQVNSYVQQLGQRLAAKSDRPNLPYTFQVIENDSVNAFATLGGFVYMHSGLLKTADNEAELASVISHEIGHIGGKHLMKQMRQQAVASGIASATGLDRNQAISLGVNLALNLPRSRKDEFDADTRGLKTLSNSGYAQSGMVSFMQKLLSNKRSTPAFLSTHPATGDRITALRKGISIQPTTSTGGLDTSTYKNNIRPLVAN
jgi:beta-barrel assembly-enhancing protease